jgi:predicted nucleic acid-binding protein
VERKTIGILLSEFVSLENIVTIGFHNEQALATLLRCAIDDGPADFGDALIAACARSAGIDGIYSVNQRFNRAGITPIEPT